LIYRTKSRAASNAAAHLQSSSTRTPARPRLPKSCSFMVARFRRQVPSKTAAQTAARLPPIGSQSNSNAVFPSPQRSCSSSTKAFTSYLLDTPGHQDLVKNTTGRWPPPDNAVCLSMAPRASRPRPEQLFEVCRPPLFADCYFCETNLTVPAGRRSNYWMK